MSENTFEASFVGLDLSGFHSSFSSSGSDGTAEFNSESNGEILTDTRTSASKRLCSILAQEMEKKLKDNLENKEVVEQAQIRAENRLAKIDMIRQIHEGHFSEKPRSSWLEHSNHSKDILGVDGVLFSTLVSMHKSDENGARKVIPHHSVSKVHRKKRIVKAKIRR